MKIIVARLFVGVSLLALSGAAQAVETVVVGEVQAQRILIAPPQNALAKTIRSGLRDALAATNSGTRAHTDARQLYQFYGARYFEPLWLTESEDGSISFSASAQGVIALFEQAHFQGLDPADYLTADLDVAAATGDAQKLAALEGAFSAAMLRYAQDAYSGRLDPRTVSGYIDIAPKRVDETRLLTKLSSSSDPASVLMDFHPSHREFIALRTLLGKHLNGEIEALAPLPGGALLRPDMSDPRVPLLRERLGLLPAETAAENRYDAELANAVKAFQGEMGLLVDGVIGPATIAALNGAGGATAPEIVANMEYWRWMPEDLGEFNVFVNTPEFGLEVNKYGKTVFETKVIVGTAKRQTPVFSDEIQYVVTNPFWNVPPTILRQDVLPRVTANPGYLASQNMELLYGGRVIDPMSVDWSATNPSQFRVRQRPGRSNALGQVKFLFPNKHDVYLHDTNSPGLFGRSMRALSSGCVRVEHPFEFAEALLQFEPSFSVASVESSLGPSERWFSMDHKVPVHLAYLTLRINEDGTVRSFGDLYGHTGKVIAMLGLE